MAKKIEAAQINPAETENIQTAPAAHSNLAAQGWFGLAVWMSFGLLFEGLIGFRAPVYLQDATRRELFRLAHAHGTILSLLLLITAVYLHHNLIALPKIGLRAMQIGVITMPLGFLLGGIKHYESDPNFLIFLAPLGGLLIIFSVITIAFSSLKK